MDDSLVPLDKTVQGKEETPTLVMAEVIGTDKRMISAMKREGEVRRTMLPRFE